MPQNISGLLCSSVYFGNGSEVDLSFPNLCCPSTCSGRASSGTPYGTCSLPCLSLVPGRSLSFGHLPPLPSPGVLKSRQGSRVFRLWRSSAAVTKHQTSRGGGTVPRCTSPKLSPAVSGGTCACPAPRGCADVHRATAHTTKAFRSCLVQLSHSVPVQAVYMSSHGSRH